MLRSDTPGRTGRNQARKRPDRLARRRAERLDRSTTRSSRISIPRSASCAGATCRSTRATLSWRPQIRRSETIRNLNFGTSVDYYKGADGRIETRTQEATTGIPFENNGFVNFTATETFDRLVSPFAIRPSITLPAGDYDYRRYSLQRRQRQQPEGHCERQHQLGRVLERAQPIDGRRAGRAAELSPRASTLSYSRNHVTLPNGEFTTQLLGARILYGFTSAALPERVPAVQRRHAAGQLEHPLQFHPPSAERHLHRLQRPARHDRRASSSSAR